MQHLFIHEATARLRALVERVAGTDFDASTEPYWDDPSNGGKGRRQQRHQRQRERAAAEQETRDEMMRGA